MFLLENIKPIFFIYLGTPLNLQSKIVQHGLILLKCTYYISVKIGNEVRIIAITHCLATLTILKTNIAITRYLVIIST